MAVSAKSITEMVSKLECGKSAGPDGISGEYFNFFILKYMCYYHYYFRCVSLVVIWLFTFCTIVPIVKNKAGDLPDSNNYRPIAIATITSKLLESVLLLKCSDYLTTYDNQFGFKASHGTDMCRYTHTLHTRRCWTHTRRTHVHHVYSRWFGGQWRTTHDFENYW